MAARVPEAERIAACRRRFQRAMRENVSVAEATRREAAERWRRTDERLARRAAQVADVDEEDGRVRPYWQRD
jgi:hypothetical protein